MLQAANCSYLHTKTAQLLPFTSPYSPASAQTHRHGTANNLSQRLIQAVTERRQNSGCNSSFGRRQASAQAGVGFVDILLNIHADAQKLAGLYPTSTDLPMPRLTTKRRSAGLLLLAQYVSCQMSLGSVLTMVDREYRLSPSSISTPTLPQ